MYKRNSGISDWIAAWQPCVTKSSNFSSISTNGKNKTNIMRNTNNSNYSHAAKNSSNADAYDYYSAADIQKRLGIGRTKAYELINELNKKLEANGKIVLSGRIPKSFFNEQLY